MIIIRNIKGINKYIDNISKYIYKKLTDLGLSTLITERDERLNGIYINSNIEDDSLERYSGNGYTYYLKINKDGNLEEIAYKIDENIIGNNWINLSDNIVEEIKNNFFYNEDRQVSKTYKVKKGDNLYDIAKRFNTSVETLKIINNLDSDNIDVGQILLIEPQFNTGEEITTYVVEDDETLEDIAKKFNTNADTIKEINNLQDDNISEGNILVIPITINKQDNLLYIVKEGDSLYSIAKKFDTSVNELKKLNNLKSNLLTIGTQLIVGINKDNDFINYTVGDDDNIYSIANIYGITIEEIKNLNNLKSNELVIGQVLKIPK